MRELGAARAALGAGAAHIAMVPTMGALHEGHIALVTTARAAGGPVAASIFVNPAQFGANEDYTRYPRTEEADLAKLAAAGCDIAWLPDVATMYPPEDASMIHVAGPARRWEGEIRPGHFAGVATVVAKLFGQVRPARAYFGEKDWQQIRVIARMTEDLLLPVRIMPVATIREADGLALSSRNRFLDGPNRAVAPALHAALATARNAILGGGLVATALSAAVAGLGQAGLTADYFALVEAGSLEPVSRLDGPARLLAAAKLGPIRLLDNVPVG